MGKPDMELDGDEEEASDTMEFIAEARRPLLVERHRQLVEEMEGSLSDAFITGESDNQRLQAMLRELDSDSEHARVRGTITALADDPHYVAATLRDALVEELCLLRERGSIEIATLQLHVIGVYRAVRRQTEERTRVAPPLADLRALPVAMLTRLLNPIPPQFGSPSLLESLVYTPTAAATALAAGKRLRRGATGDEFWQDAAGDPPLAREVEEPLEKLPELERKVTRQLLVRDRIRSSFYRYVFLEYMAADTLDPRDVETHPTILAWLEAIEATPHLFPFMQGQTAGQKLFRLSQLLQKLIQLHEMYARLSLATKHPVLKDQFTGKGVRDQLQIMAKAHYPPIPMSNDLTLAVLLCPFAAFVAWVQTLVADRNFIVPPDPKAVAR
jgi:hypothetical protein